MDQANQKFLFTCTLHNVAALSEEVGAEEKEKERKRERVPEVLCTMWLLCQRRERERERERVTAEFKFFLYQLQYLRTFSDQLKKLLKFI